MKSGIEGRCSSRQQTKRKLFVVYLIKFLGWQSLKKSFNKLNQLNCDMGGNCRVSVGPVFIAFLHSCFANFFAKLAQAPLSAF